MRKLTIKKSSIYWISFVLAFSLPLYSTNNIGKFMTNPVYIITAITGVVVVVLKRGNLRAVGKTKINLWILLYFFGVFVAAFEGYLNQKDISIFLVWYIMPVFAFWIVKYIFSMGYSLFQFMNFIYYCGLVSSVITFVMILTQNLPFWGITAYLGSRIGGSYESLFLFSVPYGIYLLFMGKGRIPRVIILIGTTMALFDVIYAQSRGLFLLLVISIILVILWGGNRKEGRNISKTMFTLKFITIVTVVVAFGVFVNGNSDLSVRLTSTSLLSQNDTWLIRVFTYIDNFNKFIQQPFGYGFGSEMNFMTGTNTVLEKVYYYIDNTYLTMGVHGGIFLMVPYIVIIWLSIKKAINGVKKSSIMRIILYSFVLILFNCTFLSSQSIHEISVATALWVIIGLIHSVSFSDIELLK